MEKTAFCQTSRKTQHRGLICAVLSAGQIWLFIGLEIVPHCFSASLDGDEDPSMVGNGKAY